MTEEERTPPGETIHIRVALRFARARLASIAPRASYQALARAMRMIHTLQEAEKAIRDYYGTPLSPMGEER